MKSQTPKTAATSQPQAKRTAKSASKPAAVLPVKVQSEPVAVTPKKRGRPAKAQPAPAAVPVAPIAATFSTPALTIAQTSTTRSPNKQAQLIQLLSSASGATIPQMMQLTGWQAHTVRGAISGALRKRLGLNIQTQVPEPGAARQGASPIHRTYRIVPTQT